MHAHEIIVNKTYFVKGDLFLSHPFPMSNDKCQPRSQGPLLLGPRGERESRHRGRVGEDPGNKVVTSVWLNDSSVEWSGRLGHQNDNICSRIYLSLLYYIPSH